MVLTGGKAAVIQIDRGSEWLEPDGLGGFASGTTRLTRTRRYHALLSPATDPPAGRMVLVNGLEAWIEAPEGVFPISAQRYAPGVDHPDGDRRLRTFEHEPWPRWTFEVAGRFVAHEIFAVHGAPITVVSFGVVDGDADGLTLCVRPLLSGRDFHALHRENGAFRFDSERVGPLVRWQPYHDVPAVLSAHNASVERAPLWYRRFLYDRELERGLDAEEDLASPAILRFDLSRGEALWVLAMDTSDTRARMSEPADALVAALRADEARRRSHLGSRLDRAADAYLVARGEGRTIIAGYPWFGDWGRDTFIALRGLCLGAQRYTDARDILLAWSGVVKDGLLPNRFPDRGPEPEYNSVDAALFYVIAADAYFRATRGSGIDTADDRARIERAILAIVNGFARGTRYGIRLDDDGLIAAGEPGSQLTWMDARVDGRPITPRIGKPVEIQALWLNALAIAERLEPRWERARERGEASFATRFWNESAACLYDVVDVDHRRGTSDAALRPNQIFAVGGLPRVLLPSDRARAVVDAVEQALWTPVGLRSLAPSDPDYAPRYEGGPSSRDRVYHQGTVWPWLIGPFVEAWVRVRGGTAEAKRVARARFLAPLLETLDRYGIGHLSEIADGDPPHTMRGCPFQAWSIAEVIRLDRDVLYVGRNE